MQDSTARQNPSVAVIGAGMTGILMAIKLREAGITDITILEKADKLGGTWRENTYPGVACDVPAHMYTYSFRGNPEWSHRFARGAEIQQYFQQVADEQGVTGQVRFNEAVESCHYVDGKWQLGTSKGTQLEVDFVVSATGILHHPAYPDIEGLDSFKGDMWHTARWNHDVDLAGKRVGIIGTGSTACQAIGEIGHTAGHLTVFQRTPQWIIRVADKSYSEADKARLRGRQDKLAAISRRYAFVLRNTFSKAVTGSKLQHAYMSWTAKRNLRKSVRDPELRKKLTPDYPVGCKRLIINNTFYDAVQRDNVTVETTAIERICDAGVVTSDGVTHELDVLILATGFHPFNFMRPMDLRGRNGQTIDEAWSKKVQAYRSLCLPGFPNFFLMLGPNTPIGNYSVIAMSEVQASYMLKLIDLWRRGDLPVVEATEQAKQRFNAYLREGMKNTVWVGGCQSWYLDADGDPAMWPYSWQQWEKELQQPELDDFVRVAPEEAEPLRPAA
ncbi:flavin-containing monooxygenase [Pseudohalioglobus lutimaris]|uniref:NAD(P)/FAD-dependent oxidoreductase n=1 Tax=Pseudohalioglobus lutimaris TaxID=1737061 RepID=A0A2N5X475_9GAMM|nr:NAD(P)/FAD-dependent oxidoreductase [Pseudohalioglobus lutimaris]PLW69289.1 NAD(P)/FAD-dependent oxidoreductase [Pseudohalioglobus lutimaris]